MDRHFDMRGLYGLAMTRGRLWDMMRFEKPRVSETGRWKVVGDHPVFVRPDKFFSGLTAERDGRAYAMGLKSEGYENVRCARVYDCASER